jgi:hypothetical protein
MTRPMSEAELRALMAMVEAMAQSLAVQQQLLADLVGAVRAACSQPACPVVFCVPARCGTGTFPH